MEKNQSIIYSKGKCFEKLPSRFYWYNFFLGRYVLAAYEECVSYIVVKNLKASI